MKITKNPQPGLKEPGPADIKTIESATAVSKRTKTTFHAIQGLHERFSPAKMHVISDKEAGLIRTELELEARTDLEVQDVRDMAVMLYSQYAEIAEKKHGLVAMQTEMDAMSAICAVIDAEKSRRGMDV